MPNQIKSALIVHRCAHKDYQKLLVVAEIYRQQLQMNENKENRIEGKFGEGTRTNREDMD